MATDTSLHGRVFRSSGIVEGGEVAPDTTFEFHERDGVVWAEYSGGEIVRGFLVGTREDDRVDFRYVQLNQAGVTSTGHSVDRIVVTDDGRLELHERWEWESRPGSGTSVLAEVELRAQRQPFSDPS